MGQILQWSCLHLALNVERGGGETQLREVERVTHGRRVYPAHTVGERVQHGSPANGVKCVFNACACANVK